MTLKEILAVNQLKRKLNDAVLENARKESVIESLTKQIGSANLKQAQTEADLETAMTVIKENKDIIYSQLRQISSLQRGIIEENVGAVRIQITKEQK